MSECADALHVVLGVSALTAALGCGPPAPPPSLPEVRLYGTTAVRALFTAPAAVHELDRGGRILVADPSERTLTIVGVERAELVRVGREGSGPGRFRIPREIIGAPGRPPWIFDLGQDRFLELQVPQGTLESAPTLPEALRRAKPVGMDTLGRVYLETANSGSDDSSTIVRWDPVFEQSVPIGVIDAAERYTQQFRSEVGGATTVVSMRVPVPFARGDEWGVAPDGNVTVVSASPLRIQIRAANGEIVHVQDLDFPRIAVTGADEAAIRRTVPRNAMPPLPDTKPAIVDGSARSSPSGELWVRLHDAAGADSSRYLVIPGHGETPRIARVPAAWTLVGLGEGTAYFGEPARDGLVRIVRVFVDYGAVATAEDEET